MIHISFEPDKFRVSFHRCLVTLRFTDLEVHWFSCLRWSLTHLFHILSLFGRLIPDPFEVLHLFLRIIVPQILWYFWNGILAMNVSFFRILKLSTIKIKLDKVLFESRELREMFFFSFLNWIELNWRHSSKTRCKWRYGTICSNLYWIEPYNDREALYWLKNSLWLLVSIQDRAALRISWNLPRLL